MLVLLRTMLRVVLLVAILVLLLTHLVSVVMAQAPFGGYIATTTVTTSICGNSLVEPGEECDVPGETGSYSTTIAGRQCTPACQFGPYCGDGILQPQFGEECDDGNNDDADFCSSICKIEPAGSGGGGSSGGGSSSGGSNEPIGDTQISVRGIGVPRATVNILLDTENVGSVQTNSSGQFEFTTESTPGTVSMGFWYTDPSSIRSITYNTVFDVTQGAITNVNGVVLPPTIELSDAEIDPGQPLELSGYAAPGTTLELHIGSSITETTEVGSDGSWAVTYDTSNLAPREYTIRARTRARQSTIQSESGYSSSIQLFLGVEGRASTPSDLNRDGSVNLIDFSILIFWWQTNGGNSNPPADINGNGNVGLEDFSILLFNWSG